MDSKLLNLYAKAEPESINILGQAMKRLNLSARAYDRILKVSRTIADMDNSESIKPQHIAEAISYRSLDRENWGS
jgi:magnesium chelatase family protein